MDLGPLPKGSRLGVYQGLVGAWRAAALRARDVAEARGAPPLEWVVPREPRDLSRRWRVLEAVAKRFGYGSPEAIVRAFTSMLGFLIEDPWWHSAAKRTSPPTIDDLIGSSERWAKQRATAKSIASRERGASEEQVFPPSEGEREMIDPPRSAK